MIIHPRRLSLPAPCAGTRELVEVTQRSLILLVFFVPFVDDDYTASPKYNPGHETRPIVDHNSPGRLRAADR
jgi:hypothetical protein